MKLVGSGRVRLGVALTCLLVALGLWLPGPSRAAISPTGIVNITTSLGYQQASAAGTGMVLTSSGRILTNNHVIRGATTVRVTVPATGRTYTATVLGYSVSADVALLQLKQASGLATVTVSSSSRVVLGQRVTAFGNAGGAGGAPARSTGKVTGLNQSITVSDGEGRAARLTNLIRIDAELEPGDSGGALLDRSGRVIGMNTAASVGFEFTSSAEGYAIPINRALGLARQIAAKQSSATVHIGPTPFLGLSLSSSRPGFGNGSFIAAVADGSPAARAGLTVGGLITRLDGIPVSSPDAISTILLKHKPGDAVTVRWIDRNGGTHTSRVTTVSGPPQ